MRGNIQKKNTFSEFREPHHYFWNWWIKRNNQMFYSAFHMSISQSNQIVAKGKFLFMEVFLLINEDGILPASCWKCTAHLWNILFFFFWILLFLYSRFLLAIYFIHISVYMSIPISQFITAPHTHPSPLPPLVSIRLFSTSVSQFLPCKPVHLYHFSRFHI